MMDHIMRILRSPGARRKVISVAMTQSASQCTIQTSESNIESNCTGYTVQIKRRLLDRWLDATVRFSGSEPVFFFVLAGLIAWALAGIKYHSNIDWQVSISDVQAILSYLFDSLLMRQQLNSYGEAMVVSAQLRSRAQSHLRMLQQIARDINPGLWAQLAEDVKSVNAKSLDAELPSESWLGRFTTATSKVLGHVSLIIFYWASMLVWLAFGPFNNWSNEWQLYCNSATSALMTFVFCFLANIRQRHSLHMAKCLDEAYELDSALEQKLRALTGDKTPNEVFVIEAPQADRLQRAIFYYADIVGTLVGVALLIIVIIVWVAVGPLLKFNDTWGLLIGTYAGLVGLNDGFVLRNVQAQLRIHESSQFSSVMALDSELFAAIALPPPASVEQPPPSLSDKVSMAIGRSTAHAITVVLGMLLIIGLLVGASVMGWKTTGQLLCNVPPSIIETFFMIVLITGHNVVDAERRVQLMTLQRRRLSLTALVEKVASIQH